MAMPGTAISHVDLRVLGPFRAIDLVTGQDITPRGRKARGLLALLALSDTGRLSRERAAGLLWSDRGAEQARVSLRQTLAEIRHAAAPLSGLVSAAREHLALDGTRASTELGRILALGPEEEPAALLRELDSAGGELLDDLEGLSPGFDDWLLAERPYRRDLMVAALLRAVDRADAVTLRGILAALERIDPGNEHVARLGMQADQQAGDLARLHRRYRRLVDVLRREFDTHPSVETRKLFHELTALAQGVNALPRALSPVPAPAQPKPAATPPVVIVSPIAPLDEANNTGTIAAICTDDIRTALARHRDIRVIAINELDVERVERVCACAISSYLLSGSLRATEAGLRCNVKLGGTSSGLVLWSDQFTITDATMTDAINKIVAKTAGAVAPVIERDLTNRTAGDGTGQEVALLYVTARILTCEARNLKALRNAAVTLERVIAADPRHTNARLLLAQLYNTDFFQRIAGHDLHAYRARAFNLALEASALDPDNPTAHLRLAWCYLRRADWDRAAASFERALALGPFDAATVNEVGFGYCHLGDLESGERYLRRAFQLNPFPPTDYHADMAVLLALKGEAAAAEAQFEVSSDPALHYLAVRLANLLRLNDALVTATAATLRKGFAAVWTGDRAWSDDDLVEWVTLYLPLRDAGAQSWLRGSLMQGLARPR